jgi:type IV pilus assembly protein PilV
MIDRSEQGFPRIRASREAGFSLIEVLVTTVVFSIGILGIAGLNAVSKRASFEAVQRSTAAELAYTLLENMRANSAALTVYVTAATVGRGSLGTTEPSPACSSTVACDQSEFATHTLWEWERMLDGGMEQAGGSETGGLLSPTACIAGPADGSAGDYSVTIVWKGSAQLTDGGTSTCGTSTGLYGTNNDQRRIVVVQSYIDPSL